MKKICGIRWIGGENSLYLQLIIQWASQKPIFYCLPASVLKVKAELPETTVDIIASACRGCGVHLLEAKAQGAAPKRLKLEVIIDSETGITHEDCRNVSKSLDALAESDGFLAEVFAIDVLSPGADRPLTEKWQYPKHIGRALKITLKTGGNITGILQSATENGVQIVPQKQKKTKEEQQPAILDFADIASAAVQIIFK